MFVYHTRLHTMVEPSNLNKITLKYEIGIRLVLTQLVTQAQRFSRFMILTTYQYLVGVRILVAIGRLFNTTIEVVYWFGLADPLLVRAARKEKVERPPAWMMRQAGRYMASYRKLTEKHPSFRERSENTDLIVEISLQPWKAFRPDGVIIFSDILTPLPAIGIPFEIDESKGPILDTPIRSEEGLKALHSIDLEKVGFVGESLSILRQEVYMVLKYNCKFLYNLGVCLGLECIHSVENCRVR